MITIIPVNNKKLLKRFVDFQPKLYKGCPYYVPPLRADEIQVFTPGKSVHLGEDASAQCFLALRDGEIVGRIAGIIQHNYNKKFNQKRARFSRFDCIDNLQVAKALFSAVEKWAMEQGMNSIHGPLGFNDLEREGLLVEGFDLISTFETQYNYPYYAELMDKCGYHKDVDWLEYQITIPDKIDERNARLSNVVAKRCGLHEVHCKSVKELVDKYYNQIFDLLDEAYSDLYATVPLTQKVRDGLLSQFKLLLDKDFISILTDENDKVVALGIAFPAINKGVQRANGKLFPFGFIHILKSIKNVEVVDLALIGVKEEYQAKGVTSIIFANILQRFIDRGVKIAETNCQLEENYKVQALFTKVYESKLCRRRRAYVKDLSDYLVL